MKTPELNPEQSLALITEVINEAKQKFEEKGAIYMVWGLLIGIAGISQFFLLTQGFAEYSHYPYFILPVGSVISWIYYSKKTKSKGNQISTIHAISWVIISANLLTLGFFFYPTLKANLIPILLVLLGIGIAISGSIHRSRIVIVSGIFINLTGLICFKLAWIWNPLALGIASLLFIFLPGLLLMINYKRKHV